MNFCKYESWLWVNNRSYYWNRDKWKLFNYFIIMSKCQIVIIWSHRQLLYVFFFDWTSFDHLIFDSYILLIFHFSIQVTVWYSLNIYWSVPLCNSHTGPLCQIIILHKIWVGGWIKYLQNRGFPLWKSWLKMEDNLNTFKNGRQPQLLKMENYLNFFKMKDTCKAETYFRIGSAL